MAPAKGAFEGHHTHEGTSTPVFTPVITALHVASVLFQLPIPRHSIYLHLGGNKTIRLYKMDANPLQGKCINAKQTDGNPLQGFYLSLDQATHKF